MGNGSAEAAAKERATTCLPDESSAPGVLHPSEEERRCLKRDAVAPATLHRARRVSSKSSLAGGRRRTGSTARKDGSGITVVGMHHEHDGQTLGAIKEAA